MKTKIYSIKFDETATAHSNAIRDAARILEAALFKLDYKFPRSRSKAFTRLEECLMWANKAVRDEQQHREKKIKADTCADRSCE